MEELRSVLKDLAAERLKRTTRGRARSKIWAARPAHQRESKEHSQADQAGEVRFGGFGLLSGQNGPPEGEQGAQPSRPSWRGPFWRIWAAERPKRATGGSKEHSQANQWRGPLWSI